MWEGDPQALGVLAEVKSWKGSVIQTVWLAKLILLEESRDFSGSWPLRSGSEELRYRHAAEGARKEFGTGPNYLVAGRVGLRYAYSHDSTIKIALALPGTHSVAQAVLKLVAALTLECWDYRHESLHSTSY